MYREKIYQEAALEYLNIERKRKTQHLDAEGLAFIAGAIWADRNPAKGRTSMTFGEAIEALKLGAKVTRSGWNGKGMFLWLKPAAVIHSDWCKDPLLKDLAEKNGGSIEALGTICMKTADNKVLTGWLPSQSDMLSKDWTIVV